MTSAILKQASKQASKQAERCYNYVVSGFCHVQTYIVKIGAFVRAGNCAAESVFLFCNITYEGSF